MKVFERKRWPSIARPGLFSCQSSPRQGPSRDPNDAAIRVRHIEEIVRAFSSDTLDMIDHLVSASNTLILGNHRAKVQSDRCYFLPNQ
jgi:hypothetical protein